MKVQGTIALLLAGCGAYAVEGMPRQFNMPDTGLLPSYVSVQAATRMGERHGGSDLSWSSYRVTVPILDPRKSGMGMWRFNAALESDATVLGAGGGLDLRRNELYTFTMPVTFIRPQEGGGYLALGVAPSVASDFAGTSRMWDIVPFANYKMQVSDTFSWSLGVAVSPRFAKNSVIPLVGFSWTPVPEWEIRLEKLNLSAFYSVDGRLKVGPYIGGYGGSWMVDTAEGDRIFRISGVAMGVAGEYDFHKVGQTKRIIFASMGVTAATRADFCERTADKDHYETHHYKPGFIVSVGVDFRF